MSIANHHRFIAKVLVSTAVVFGALIGASAPASADPNTAGADPHAFSGLSCSCQKKVPVGDPAATAEIDRGIREGLSVAVPGLPAPPQPRP
jgi:hypothetical protein